MRRPTFPWMLALPLLLTAAAPAAAGEVTAAEAFDRLAALTGGWHGPAEGSGAAAEAEADAVGEVKHTFELSAAGTVVMETMNPGTEHEMINMYHLDGEDLVLTHYCAGGNQPRMRLDRESSTAGRLVFDFAGGTNLDPATDPHIHSAEITLLDDGRVKSAWTSHADGAPAGGMVFLLSRSEG